MITKNALKKILVIGILLLFVVSTFITIVSSDTLMLENLDFNNKPAKFADPIWLWASSGGGTDDDYGVDFRVECYGNSFEVGYFKGTANFGSTILTSNGNYDFYIAKMDADGDWEWAISGGSNGADYAYGLEMDYDWNSYITGKFQGTANFGSTVLTSSGSYDIFVAKIDSTGNWQWAKKAGGSSSDHGNDIFVDSNRNSYITGEFSGTANFGSNSITSSGSSDVFVAKIDSTGNWQWAKNAGGTDLDAGYNIRMANDNAYITGEFQGTANFGSNSITSSGGSDVFVAKIDSSGNWDWANDAGGSNTDTGYGIYVDSSGNSYITGEFQGTANFGSNSITSSGGSDVFVAKIDSSGNWDWANDAGGSNSDTGYGIRLSYDSSYITGEFQGTANFGSNSITSSGGSDVFVAKIDINGNWDWAMSGGGSGNDRGKGIGRDSTGTFYVIGNFYGNANFGSIALTSSGQSDIFVASLEEEHSGNNSPPYKPSNPMPVDGAINVDIYTDLSWTGGDPDEGDTVVYDIYLDANNPDPTTKVSDDQSDTTLNPGTLESETIYYWKVHAKDSHGRTTKGPIWHFTTEELQNEPPDPPIIEGQPSGKPGVSYVYKFTSNDPDGDEVSYYIKWGDEEITDWTTYQSSGSPGYSEGHRWNENGTYIIKAKAKDVYGAESNWAELEVSMPRNRHVNKIFLQRLTQIYPTLTIFLRFLQSRLGKQ